MKIKFALPVLAVLLAMAASLAVQPADAQAPAGRRPRIAVMDFDYATVQSSTSALFGSNVDVGK